VGAPANRLFRAAEAFFLADSTITGLIGSNMHQVVSERKIVAEKAGEEAGTKLGPFVEYELESEERGKLLGAKSRFSVARVLFRFHARYPKKAGELYDAFYARVHPVATPSAKYSGTWATGTEDVITVMGAWWDDAAVNENWDDSLGMVVLQSTLQVPYKVPLTG
jgi:hypothetical protein